MSWLARMDISRKASLNSARAWIWVRNLPMRTTGVRAAMARAGRVEDTVIHVEKAVRLMLQSADYCDKLGRLFAAKDSIAEALLRFEQAATLTGLQACDSEDARCQVLQHQAAIRRPSGRHSHTRTQRTPGREASSEPCPAPITKASKNGSIGYAVIAFSGKV